MSATDNSKKKFAVIFDMDGVIVDSNPYHKKAIRHFNKKYDISLSDHELENKVFGRTNESWLREVFGKDLSDKRLKELEEEKESYFREIFAADIKPLPGLLPFLRSLQEAGIPAAVASSAPEKNVSFTLERTGSVKYFKLIVNGDSVTHSKPHPEIYLKTAGKLNMAPEHCIVFEDSLSGVQSAKRANCRVIGITTTHSKEDLKEADKTIADFHEITIDSLNEQFTGTK
ncbi:MAG: HAD family phosphatase [Calditrichia bacterium]